MEEKPWWQRLVASTGGAFRFGKGLVSKSARVVAIFLVVAGMAIYRLSEPTYILIALGIAATGLIVWLAASFYYADKHPDAVLLEGAEWRGWQEFQASAKGLPAPKETLSIADPGYQPALPKTGPPESEQ